MALVNYENNILTHKCENCMSVSEHDLVDYKLNYIEENREYENLPIKCTKCPDLEIFNVNIPSAGEEVELTHLISTDEFLQRAIIRQIREERGYELS